MRTTFIFGIFPLLALAQITRAQTAPVILDPLRVVGPSISSDGNSIVFGAATSPDGSSQGATNLYLWTSNLGSTGLRALTKYTGPSSFAGVSGVALAATGSAAAFMALPSGPGGPEEVHVIDTATAADKTVATNKTPCALPLCVSCFGTCLGPVHLSADAGKVLYAVAAQRPFFLVNSDGSGLTQLPIYSGSLAPSPQRVISRNGLVVFTSSAPFGPTFAAASTDVYVMNLDGTGVKQVTNFGNPGLVNPLFFAGSATISADGALIAFESNFSANGPSQTTQIWVVRSDGADLRQLTSGSAATGPSLSGDGSIVTFLQSGQIKRVQTGDSTSLTLTTLTISAPGNSVVSEDGAQVALTLGPASSGSAAVCRIPTNTSTTTRSFVTIYAPTVLNANGAVAATGYAAPSPGSLITVYGANLDPDESTQAATFPLPTSLNGLSLLVNGQPVPLLTLTRWQINAQLPQTFPPGTATFQVRVSGSNASAPIVAEVKAFAPANFAFPLTLGQTSYQQASVLRAGTFVIPDINHPAAAGDVLEIYGEGLGITNPMVEAGVITPASPLARAVQLPQVRIGARDATVIFAGLAPGLIGVYQVNVIVPGGLTPGLQTLVWIQNGTGLAYSQIAVK